MLHIQICTTYTFLHMKRLIIIFWFCWEEFAHILVVVVVVVGDIRTSKWTCINIMYRNHWMSCSATIKTYSIMPCCTYLCVMRALVCVRVSVYPLLFLVFFSCLVWHCAQWVRFTQCQFSLAKIATRFHIISQMTYNINSFLFASIRQKTNQTNLNVNEFIAGAKGMRMRMRITTSARVCVCVCNAKV